jgi:hypothetical protein
LPSSRGCPQWPYYYISAMVTTVYSIPGFK